MNQQEREKILDEEEKRIQETVSNIKHRIAVFSGKGGVGKTTVSVNLAMGFQFEGFTTGILDADITGPNVPKMLGIDSDLIVLDSKMIPFERFGVKVISMASLVKNGQALIWRGPMRSKVINQFLADAERAINMAKKLEIPFIGVIENMSGFVCPHCSAVVELFGSGGGKKLADDYNIPFLGSIPIDIDARICSDNGKPIVAGKPDCEVSTSFKVIANLIDGHYRKE